MARKTFGRAGQSIAVVEGDAASAATDTDNDGIGTIIVEDNSAGNVANQSASDVREDQFDVGESHTSEYDDPANIAQQPAKRRGRKPGTKNKVKNFTLVTANLEKVLFNLHIMGSAMLSEPELAIDEDEAKLLAEAVGNVATAYDFHAILSPKTQATVDLSIALVTVYGRRVMTIARKHGGKAKQNVTPISQVK